jgi:hypothetical protein
MIGNDNRFMRLQGKATNLTDEMNMREIMGADETLTNCVMCNEYRLCHNVLMELGYSWVCERCEDILAATPPKPHS